MAALMLLVLLDGTSGLEGLADPAHAVRERAIEELARSGPPTADLVPHLLAADARLAAGVAAVLERREDPAALPGLLRGAAHEDGERAAAAARAAVRVAFAALEPLDAQAPPLVARRLAEAVEAEVRRRLGAFGGSGSQDQAALYRGILAGEAYSAAVLLRLMEDVSAPPGLRGHACHAALRLLGPEAAPVYVRLLGDAEPRVRAAAADCIVELDDRGALESLAALFDGGRSLQEPVVLDAARAARRTRLLGGAGAERLEQIVRQGGDAAGAVTAALALQPTWPERCRRAVRERVRSYLTSESVAPGAAAPASLFLLAGLPVDERERLALRASSEPLVRAPAEADPATVLEALRPVIAPARPIGGQELLRIQIVSALLRRCDAPAADRVAFAAGALDTDSASARHWALQALEGVPEGDLEPLVPRLLLALRESSEVVRVAAAELLFPREPAVRALALALHDGRPWHVARAAEALRRLDGGPAPDPAATPAERRAFARALLRRIPGGARDKE